MLKLLEAEEARDLVRVDEKMGERASGKTARMPKMKSSIILGHITDIDSDGLAVS